MATQGDTVLIQAREAEIEGLSTSTDHTRPANEFHGKETSPVEACLGPDYGKLGGESLTHHPVKGNDAAFGSGACQEIGKESEDVLYRETQDRVEQVYLAKSEHQQETKGVEEVAEEKNEQIIAELELEQGAGKQEMTLTQTINVTQKAEEESYAIDETADLASRINLLEDETQEANSITTDPALETDICSKENAGHDSLRVVQEESIATNTQVGDSKVHPYAAVPEEEYDQVTDQSESKEDGMQSQVNDVPLGSQETTILGEDGIENMQDMIPNAEKTCLESTIVDQTETSLQGVETESESIEKVESIVLDKEAAFMLGETSHPSSQVTLQNKLESSDALQDKIKINKGGEFVNVEEPCIEHLDDQGEPPSGPKTVIDTVADIKDETDKQPGVPEQQAEKSISGTEAVRDYDKPLDKVSEYIEGAATFGEQADFIKQGQPIVAVEETQGDEFVNAEETCTEHLDDQGEPPSGPETAIGTVADIKDETNEQPDVPEQQTEESISGNLNEEAVSPGVSFTSIIPEATRLPDINATEQENTSETKMPEESIESYEIEGKEMQTAVNGTGISATEELNAHTGEDGKQASNFTEEKDEYHGTESTIHEADQEDASVDKNFDVSTVKDEAIDIGDDENAAVSTSINSENLISEDVKEENKMQMEDVQQESLAEDLISQCDNTVEKKVQIGTSDEFSENDRFKDTLLDSLAEKVTEGYQDNENVAMKLSQEVVDKTNEELSISSPNAKHETSGEEEEATETAINETTAEPPNYDNVKDTVDAPVAENTISQYGIIEKKVAQEDAIEDFIEDDQIKGTSPESPLGKMAEGDPDDAREANELAGKNLSAVSKEVETEHEEVKSCSSVVKDETIIEVENENLSRLEDEQNGDGEINSLTAIEEVANISESITSQDEKKGENIQEEDAPQESEAENIVCQFENTAETDTKDTSEEFKEETGISPEYSAKEYSENKQEKELSKENFENLSTVTKEAETEHSDLSTDASTEKYETTAEGENENVEVEVEEHADLENVVGGDSQDDDTEVKTIQLQDVSPEPFEENIVSQIDQDKSTSMCSLTVNLDEGDQDNGKEAEEVAQKAVDTETEDLSLSSHTEKYITSGGEEYLDLSRVGYVATDSGEHENTAVEPPKIQNIMEEASTISGNITYLDDNNEEKTMEASKDVPTVPVEENMASQNSGMEEKFVQDTTEVFTEDEQVKGTLSEPPQEKMIESDTDDGKETSELPEKKLESHSALSEEVDTEHEDLSCSSIAKDETNAEAENESLSGLEGEISENGDNTPLTAIEEVSTISENITACNDKREEEKIQMEDVSQEPVAEKIISQSENTAEKVTQIEHPSHESTAELGVSPDSPAEEISEGYSDHREAKQLPEEISESLSIVSKEIGTDHLCQSIDTSIEKYVITAEGENEKLAVEEHTEDDSITFQDDNAELKITQLEDVTPEPMEENFVTQNTTEDDQEKREETSIQFKEDEYVKGASAESSIAEGHIEEDGKGGERIPEEKYENICKESEEEGKELEDLIHDTSKCETGPGGDEESLEVQEHPKDEKSTTAPSITENKASHSETADEENTQSEDISENFTEDGHVMGASTETSFKQIVESNINDVEAIEELPEEQTSTNRDDEHLTLEASPEDDKINEEASAEAVNITSQDYKNEEKETQMEGPNAQSPDENDLVDTPRESLAEGKAESPTDDVHEAMEGTSEQYNEESSLEDTPSKPLEEKEETYTNDGKEGKGFTQELTTTGGESFSVEHAAVEREQEDLDLHSSISDHATITMEDNEESIVEKKLENDDDITEEKPLSTGNTIHQEDDSIEAVKIQQEDGPETSMERSAPPLDDKTGQTADEKSTEASSIADEEKVQSEHMSENFTEDGHVTNTSAETSFEKIVESDIHDEEVIECPQETSANGEDEHLTSEGSPEHAKIINEASSVCENIISHDNENEEKEMQMEGTNAQSPDESNLVDTPRESLAEGKAESSTDDVHKAMEGNVEQYKEESNLEDTPSETLSETEAEISTDDKQKGRGFTEELTTMAGESFSVEHAAVEREQEDLDLHSTISDHATITMEDNEESTVEKKLKNDDNITGEAPVSAGDTSHQEDDSIDAAKIQEEDGPKEYMERSATPLDDRTEGQTADEKSTEASSIAGEEKAQSEHMSQNFTEDGHVTNTSAETSFEKTVESNIHDEEVIEECPQEMSANGDDEHLTSEASPEHAKIIKEASSVCENIISQDNENEEKEMQMEGTNAQSQDESNLVDTPRESLAEGKAESSTEDAHEAMEGNVEQYKEESNLEDTPFEPLEEKEAEISTDDGQKGKGFTAELRTMEAESFSVEDAVVEREQEELDLDSSISEHAAIPMEGNEELIVEKKLKNDDNITGEAPVSAGDTIHREDDSTDAAKIQNEDEPETTIEGSTTPLDDKTEGQNAQIEDSSEELTKDEDATGISPGYPSEDVLQTTTNEEKEYSSKQKCEDLFTESTEIEKDCEDAANDSESPNDGTAKESVKPTDDEIVTDKIAINEASSSIVAEVIHGDTALSKDEELLPITLSPDDKGTDQKALEKDEIEQATDTVKEINELADFDNSENDNDQLHKEEAPDASEETTVEHNMDTNQEELTREYQTGTTTESSDENIINIIGDNGKGKNELDEHVSMNAEKHSDEHTAIGEGHEDLDLQTLHLENVTSEGENKEFEEETPEKEKIIEDRSPSAGNSIPTDYNNEDKKLEIEEVKHESVEGSKVSEDYDTEEKDTQKDDISQQIEGNHAPVTSAEVPVEVDHETYVTGGNKVKESIAEECENLTAGSTQEYNEMQTTEKDTIEETVQVSSAIIGEAMADNISLKTTEQLQSTDSFKEGEGTDQGSMKDMVENKTDTKNQMEEQNDQIQREVKEQPAEIIEQEKMEEETVLNDNVIERKKDLKSPAEEYEESATRESAEGILIATASQIKEPTINLSTEEDNVDFEKNISQEPADFPDDKLKYDDAREDMATEEGSLRSSPHNREDAFDFSGQEEGNEKQQSDGASCERNESIKEEVHQDSRSDEDRSIVESSEKEVNHLSEPVVDVVTNNQWELESKTQENKLFTINDQQRETDNSEVSEENCGTAKADEGITEKCKELDSFHKLEAPERETVSEMTIEHAEASSLAASDTADDDFISADHEESFSLGQKESGKHNADEEGHDVPDEAPDAKEKNDDEEVTASSATQLGDVLELNEETTTELEAIKEVDGGTIEAIEGNNEALVATNKDVDFQEEDESKISDTEMLLTEEGHREADLTEELHEHHNQENIPSQMTTGSKFSESKELEITEEEGKETVKSNKTNNSSALEDGENQEDSTVVKGSAPETGTMAVISEQDVSFSVLNRSIREVIEVEESASAEEQNQQYQDSKYKNDSLLADESLESDGLVENTEHNTPTGNEEISEELIKHPSIEDATEEGQRNGEVTQIDGTETKLEVQYTPTTREDNKIELAEAFTMTDQVPVEDKDEIKEKGIHEAEENQNDANYLENDEIKTLISTEPAQNDEQKVTDSKSINETELSIVAETVDECHPSKERGESSDSLTNIEKEFPKEIMREENLESDGPVEMHENEIAAEDKETNEKSSRHLFDSTKEDINEESLRNEVALTKVVSENQVTVSLIMTDQAPVEPESVDNVKNIQETAEYQIDNSLQRDEMKTPTSFQSIQSEVQEAIDSTNITETESSDIMETAYSQPEVSTVAETADECDLVEEMDQSSQNNTERNNETSEKRIQENLESATMVNEGSEILSKHPADAIKADVTEEQLRCEVIPTEETETNLDVKCSINREVSENQVSEDLIMTSQVPMEPENEDKVLSAQEAVENMSDANELCHNEIKSVISSESLQIGNEQATDSNHKHEIEGSEKVETLCNNSETSPVAETVEEFGVLDETYQSPENNTIGEHQLQQRNKEENLESANLAVNLEHETNDIYEETNGKLTTHPASSTEEDMTSERPRSEVTATEDIETDLKVLMEPENEEKSKSIQELSEEQKNATNIQQDEMKIVTSSESMQNESENATNFDKISEIESLDKMGTLFNQSEASAGDNTLEESGLSDVVEGETAFESQSHDNFQDVKEIRQDGMDAKEIPQPNEVEEHLQETPSQLFSDEQQHKTPIEVIGESAADLKPLPNVREEQPFSLSELVLHDQKHEGSLLLKDIAEENTERVQSLEGKSSDYSVLQQIKDKKCFQEEVQREPDAQSLDFKPNKNLHLKEETTQETSTTDPKMIMQLRDFSSELQGTGFSLVQDSEKTTDADTSLHSSLEEAKDDRKDQATNKKEDQGPFGNAMLQYEENSLATLQTENTGKQKGEDNWHVLSVEDALVTMDEAATEEEQRPEERENKCESMPTGETIIPPSDWHQVSMSQMEGYSSKDEIAIDETEKVDRNEEDKIGGSEPVENEAELDDPSREDPGSIAPTITETSKDINVKATPKKSHNILSGVGSKVKHSISKVKKAIIGKPSQPKNTSPKKETTKGE